LPRIPGGTVARMSSSRWQYISGLLLIGGALSWYGKLAIIVGTAGRVTVSFETCLLLWIGIPLLMIGSTGAGLRLADGRPLAVRVLAVLLAPVVMLGGYLALDQLVLQPLLDGHGPAYLKEETGIFVVAVLWNWVGVQLVRTGSWRRPAAQVPSLAI
jgi:hypothetical protein